MQALKRNRVSRVESLESRLTLSASGIFNPPPPPGGTVIVAPPNGLAPILLPPVSSTAPPGTTLGSPPAPGQLPAGLPPIAGQAEQLALNSFAAFQTAHPTAVPVITDHLLANGVFTLTLTEKDGAGHSFTETVTEDKNGVAVNMAVVDGAHTEVLAAAQSLKRDQ